jgi:hypothetical protein
MITGKCRKAKRITAVRWLSVFGRKSKIGFATTTQIRSPEVNLIFTRLEMDSESDLRAAILLGTEIRGSGHFFH